MLEASVLLAVIGLVDISGLFQFKITQLQPHPFWIPVILASCVYGRLVGSVIAVAAALVDGALIWPEIAGHSDLYGFLSSSSVNAVLWLGTAAILGSFRDENTRRLRETEEARDQRATEAHLLADRCRALISEVSKLENSVASSGGSKAGKALDVFERMLSLPTEKAFEGYKQALRALIGAEGFHLLLPGENNWSSVLQLKDDRPGEEAAAQGQDQLTSEKAVRNICAAVAASGRTFNCLRDSDREVLGGLGALAAPIHAGNGNLLAVVIVREADASCLGRSGEAAIALANFILGARFHEFEASAIRPGGTSGTRLAFPMAPHGAESGEIVKGLVQR
jgi:hypothetical protein